MDNFVDGVGFGHSLFVLGQGSLKYNRKIDDRKRNALIPVLSEHITDTLPSASTECSFFTIAFRLAILKTPRARVTVVTMGRPSGIAATARDTGDDAMSANRAAELVIITHLQ
jgi:hypothetical protein